MSCVAWRHCNTLSFLHTSLPSPPTHSQPSSDSVNRRRSLPYVYNCLFSPTEGKTRFVGRKREGSNKEEVILRFVFSWHRNYSQATLNPLIFIPATDGQWKLHSGQLTGVQDQGLPALFLSLPAAAVGKTNQSVQTLRRLKMEVCVIEVSANKKKSNWSCDLHFLVQADRTFLQWSHWTWRNACPLYFCTPPHPKKKKSAIFEERFAKAFYQKKKHLHLILNHSTGNKLLYKKWIRKLHLDMELIKCWCRWVLSWKNCFAVTKNFRADGGNC